MQHFDACTGIQLVEALEPFELFLVGDAGFRLQKVLEMNELCLSLCYFFLVIGENAGQPGSRF